MMRRPGLTRHVTMKTPNDSSPRTWPLRLMACVLGALGLVPMANLVAPGMGMQWWNQSVRLWTLWAVAVGCVALLIARFAPRVGQAAPALYAWLVLRPPRRCRNALMKFRSCRAAGSSLLPRSVSVRSRSDAA